MAAPRHPLRWRLFAATALAGAAVMILELSAVRAMAPLFGSSAVVWTNVIGVVLAALAIGYGFGGRLADRRPRPRVLGGLLLAGSALLVPAPFLIRPLGTLFLPAPMPIATWHPTNAEALGSLALAAILFAPPIVLMGMVSPFVVRLLADTGLENDRAASHALAISTLGSLAGTYLPAHFLLEQIGVRATVFTAAIALLLAGLLVVSAKARLK